MNGSANAGTSPYSRFTISLPNYLSPTVEFHDSMTNTELVISLHKSPFSALSSTAPYPVEHHNPKLTVPVAPTIESYYQNFKIFVYELRTSNSNFFAHYSYVGNAPSESTYNLIDAHFLTHQSMAYSYFKRSLTYKFTYPVYWLSYDIKTKRELKLPLVYGKLAYCRLYEKFVISQPLFKLLYDQYKTFEGHVGIYSYGAVNSFSRFDTQDAVINFFANSQLDFCDAYCLMEILINYPHTENCFWNNDNIITPILDTENAKIVQMKHKYNAYHSKV